MDENSRQLPHPLVAALPLVVLIGLRETVSAMIRNDKEVERYTGLAQRIQNLYDFMHESEITGGDLE